MATLIRKFCKSMKVVIINRSDILGGAAMVSLRLAHALKDQGVDVNMLVVDKRGDDSLVTVMGNNLLNKWNFLAERLGVYLKNGMNRSTLFMIDPATHGIDVSTHPLVKEADIVCLNWVNQGTLSLKSINKLAALGKPIVWTMHDMWNCTGLCHHAYECTGYKDTCQSCHLLGGKGKDLSTTIQCRKQLLYDESNIHFVAVSNWLANKCRESRLMRNSYISVIGNPFPIDDYSFDFQPHKGVGEDAIVVAMGAARLDDPVKGFDILIDAMNYLQSNNRPLASRLHLLLYGNLRDQLLLDKIPVKFSHLGYITDINKVFRSSHIVLSTSLYESFGYTLIEGQASGCVPVTFGRGGQTDIVDHLHNGYIAEYKDPASVAAGIEWATEAGISRQFLHEEVQRKFAASKIAKQYINLFEKLLSINQ